MDDRARSGTAEGVAERPFRVTVGGAALDGDLALPAGARGVVLFAHGSGSNRRSPRHRHVARELHAAGFGTALIDLLTEREEADGALARWLRFDIELLTERLLAALDWLAGDPSTGRHAIGLFGASTGAAAALIAAAQRGEVVRAVVSRGGRPDLAGAALAMVHAPTLLIAGGADHVVLDLNRTALGQLSAEARGELAVVPGAGHLFEEPGALDAAARLTVEWFARHLRLDDSAVTQGP